MTEPVQEVQVSAQDLIDALSGQRNVAMNDAALAVARSVVLKKENDMLKQKLAEFEQKERAADGP